MPVENITMHELLANQERAWACVPGFLLRSTGFPVEQLDALRLSQSFEYATQVLRIQNEIDSLQSHFLTHMFPSILLAEQQKNASSEVFAGWYQLKRCVQKKRRCEENVYHTLSARWASLDTWMASWHALLAEQAVAQREFERLFAAEFAGVRETLASIVHDSTFQEALLLSNPNMYAVALPSYFHHYTVQKRPAKIRHLERRFYSYLQRFCMKNDTTSFFGPIDYGWIDPDASSSLLIQQEPQMPVAKRWTRMSYWSVQALAQCIARDECVQPYLIPRLQDGCTLLPDNTLFIAVKNQRLSLSQEFVALLRRIDGRQRLVDIFAHADAETQAHFDTLRRKKLILLDLTIPTAVFDPLQWLSTQVEDLPATCQTRLYWLEQLASFREKIQAFAQCTLQEKHEVLQQLEESFSRVTQQAARRGDGETYADRALIYDEARGAITRCVLGVPLYHDLLTRLQPIMHLAATFSLLVQQAAFKRARALFLASENDQPIPYLAFIHQIDTHIRLEDCMQDADVQELLYRLRVLAQQHSQGGYISLSRADIQPYLGTLPAGMMVSPDLFLASPSVEALNAGTYQIVIGEIHYGAQVWCHFLAFSDQLQDFEYFFREHAKTALSNEKRLYGTVVHRRQQGKTFPLEFPGLSVEVLGRSVKSREQVVSAADLDVQLADKHFVLRVRTTGQELELYPGDPRSVSNWLFGVPPVIMPEILLAQAPLADDQENAQPEPLADLLRSDEPIVLGNLFPEVAISYTPRIEIDGVVVQRARWSCSSAAFQPSLGQKTESTLFLRMNDYRLRYGLPVRCFARVPSERKPFFIDFATLWSLELLASLLQMNEQIEFTECLPEIDRWWLKKGEGTHSCEWRMTFVTC